MKIYFFISPRKSIFEGKIRPLINWAKWLSEKSYGDFKICLILFKCEENLVSFLRNTTEIEIRTFDRLKDVVSYLKNAKCSILISDDSLDELKAVTKIKEKLKLRTGIYVQILYGVHAISDIFDLEYLTLSEKILFSLAKLIPFKLLKKTYTKMLSKNDVVIANSNTTANLLHVLYGIEPNGIVYPPVDKKTFQPRDLEKKNYVLLYLGSHAGDTDLKFIISVYKTLAKKGVEILSLGNDALNNILISKGLRLKKLSGISDQELAEVYSRCRLVICPQKWETFGYVEAEATSCGTPVLTFNCMGMREIVNDGKNGFLANNKREFIKILNHLLDNVDSLSRLQVQNKAPFRIEESTKALIRILLEKQVLKYEI